MYEGGKKTLALETNQGIGMFKAGGATIPSPHFLGVQLGWQKNIIAMGL